MAGTAPPMELLGLVERFERNIKAYRSGAYKETELRREFVDPFFKLLGWDVDNSQGAAEAYKDVVHEPAVKIGESNEAPDYCFRVGGTRKFFVEAKKPSVVLKDDIHSAYQVRRYAWSAKLPLSILTDFDEFAVYDCRIKPAKTDKASTARVLYLTHQEYADRWDELESRFSCRAVKTGSFDKYGDDSRLKKGTASVDDAFLHEIESWREFLAKNIALRNKRLSRRDLNFAVQATIDRIIFLRMCEDRGIELYATLRGAASGKKIYASLLDLFRKADERYNSGLFHLKDEKGRGVPDELTPRLKIDDEPLAEIIGGLYYPDSPYEFSVMPAEILGHVYEKFLGKVIRLTAGHRAVVEEKPEVKKAGGVYYTPSYIVDYIVKNTVGKLLEGKNPLLATKLNILDPACGSGSFLIAAYQYLLDWHRDWYFTDGPEKHKGEMYRAPGGEWRLTGHERKRILTNHVFGVDIDPQAVEVTKLSLLLKVLEGETGPTLAHQAQLFHERALPDLANNIKCGNSLIANDFYKQKQLGLFDDESRQRINAFDWDGNEGFPQIMRAGGFSAVIGNPPYIRVRIFKEFSPEQVDYLEQKYRCAMHVWDVYLLFYERALQLARSGGLVAFIVPVQTLHQPNCESLRKMLVSEASIASIADLSHLRVFKTALVKNCIIISERSRSGGHKIGIRVPLFSSDLLLDPSYSWPQTAVHENPGFSLKADLLSPKRGLCEKLRSRSLELGELCYVTFGLRSCAKGKGQGGKERLITDNPRSRNAKPYLEGRDIGRYALRPTGRFIRYIPSEMYSPRTPALFEQKKIVSQCMLSRMKLVANLDDESFYVEQSLVCIVPHGTLTAVPPGGPKGISLEFMLGVLNSRLESFYFSTYVIDHSLGGGLIHATPGSQEKLLIPRASDDQMNRIAALVRQMLNLDRLIRSSDAHQDKALIQRQLDATDREIDRLVYELYGLTEDEIRIVEESLDSSST